jgi:hypothetical protein
VRKNVRVIDESMMTTVRYVFRRHHAYRLAGSADVAAQHHRRLESLMAPDERRPDSAAAADLALALYNPVSRARPRQLGRAVEIETHWKTND